MKFYKISGCIILAVAILAFAACGSTKDVAQTNKRLALCIDDYTNFVYKDVLRN